MEVDVEVEVEEEVGKEAGKDKNQQLSRIEKYTSALVLISLITVDHVLREVSANSLTRYSSPRR